MLPGRWTPGEARRIVAGNAGSLLFPSRDHGFGYGLGGLPPEVSDEAMLRRYFAAPLTLYLGTADTTPRKRFDASEAAMKQGPHRLARNRNGFELARKTAQERGWVFNWRKVETPGIEHDAAMMFEAKEVESALFGNQGRNALALYPGDVGAWGMNSVFRLPGVIGLVAAFLTAAAGASPLPAGPGRFECPNGAEPITVFTYKPPTYRDGPLLVVCHGVARNAEDYRNFAVTMAERFGAIVVAPLFDKERYPSERYQRGGLVGPGGRPRRPDEWTYAAIPKIVGQVRGFEGKPALPYYLIGHSAGGQFLVRLAAFLPGEAVRIVAANPGSHLFPARDQDFGYGFGGLPPELSSDEVLRRYLAAPLTLYLGTGDVTPEHSFDASPAGMRQGPNRLARGRGCFAAAQTLAKERGWAFNWRKVETPGIAHEAAYMFAAKEAGDALFGK